MRALWRLLKKNLLATDSDLGFESCKKYAHKSFHQGFLFIVGLSFVNDPFKNDSLV